MKQWFGKIVLGPHHRVVRFKSFRPWIGPYGVEWPTMLVDHRGMRETSTPVWNYYQFRAVLLRIFGVEP
jgi:hypothetical protein